MLPQKQMSWLLLFWFALRNQAEHQILFILQIICLRRNISDSAESFNFLPFTWTSENSLASQIFMRARMESVNFLTFTWTSLKVHWPGEYLWERRVREFSPIHLNLFEDPQASQIFMRARSHSIFSHSLILWKFTGQSCKLITQSSTYFTAQRQTGLCFYTPTVCMSLNLKTFRLISKLYDLETSLCFHNSMTGFHVWKPFDGSMYCITPRPVLALNNWRLLPSLMNLKRGLFIE